MYLKYARNLFNLLISFCWLAAMLYICTNCSYNLLLVVPKIRMNNLTVFENDGRVSLQVERSEGLDRNIMMNVTTVEGTALGKISLKQ